MSDNMTGRKPVRDRAASPEDVVALWKKKLAPVVARINENQLPHHSSRRGRDGNSAADKPKERGRR